MTAKENILNKIQQALQKQSPVPFPDTQSKFVFNLSAQELEIEFAEKFTKLQGKFSFCTSIQDCIAQIENLAKQQNLSSVVCNEIELQQLFQHNHSTLINQSISLANCDAAITSCEALVARTGSILLSSATESGRTYSIYTPIHICIAYTKQIVYDISNAMELMQTKYGSKMPSVISLATGPSRTADIEKTLVVGVHGPKEVYCFLIDDDGQ